MKKNKLISVLLLVIMTFSIVLTGCSSEPTEAPATPPAETPSEPESSSEIETPGAEEPSGEVHHTSKETPYVTLNGEISKLESPYYLTSVGQSADVSMLDALLKKVEAEYTYDAVAKADDLSGAKTVIIATGASSKGLGAAGISADDEKARSSELLEYCKENDITVIMAHIGGVSRRGQLSDEFTDMVLEYSSGIIMVEDGNDDGKFTDFASEKNIPITLVNTIADCIEPIKTMVGK